MNDEKFIIIPEWMIENGLTGNRVLVFALIYGYSRDGRWFQGSVSYICQRTGISRNSAIRALHSLCKDGFLRKRDRPYKGMKYVDYQAVPSAKMAPVSKRDRGSAKMAPHPVPKWDTKVNKKVKTKESIRARGNKFHNFQQREYDYDELERRLTELKGGEHG
jgi:DNA-binding transcriptional MocR family regulator